MNILLCYRLHQFKEEIVPKLIKYKDDIIYLVAGSNNDKELIGHMLRLGKINKTNIKIYSVQEVLNGDLDSMKFDNIVGNPPYQIPVGEGNKTKTIWDTLTVKFFSLLKDKGEMSLIHPGSWRFANNPSANNNTMKVKNIYQNNLVTYAEFNDINKGYETFNANTDYDVITVIKGLKPNHINVITNSENISIILGDYMVIPTDKISLFDKLRGEKDDKKVKLINNSNYHTSNGGDNCRVRKEKDSIYQYPVVDRIPQKEGVKFFYSRVKDNGHFSVPKLILAKAGFKSLLDLEGNYGMTQFCAGYVDKPENLIKIQKVVEAIFPKLKASFGGIGGTNLNAVIDAQGTMFKFIKEFRKDWWKEFYTDEMEQELIEEGVLDANGKYIG